MKYRELSQDLGDFFECEQKVLDEPEIQGRPEDILRHKLLRAYEVFKHPVLVDDVSVHFDELKGFPGPYIKYFWDHFTPYELGHKFAGSRMKAVCRLGLYDGKDMIIAEGTVEGEIIPPENNNHKGQHFDLFLRADGTDKPMIELSVEEKNSISHRGSAMKRLLEMLRNKKA